MSRHDRPSLLQGPAMSVAMSPGPSNVAASDRPRPTANEDLQETVMGW